MIVGAPNKFAAEIHDRMPVFLAQEQFEPWLSGETGAEYASKRSAHDAGHGARPEADPDPLVHNPEKPMG
jgi:putative SOS response-associated peptidase YedK